jgi:hypothetical protein
MPYADARLQRLFQRDWCRNRRAKAVELKGGKCKRCKATSNLEFHHRNPEEKEDHRIWSWKWERILAEIAKCDLLCTDCHSKHTTKYLSQLAKDKPREANGAFAAVAA